MRLRAAIGLVPAAAAGGVAAYAITGVPVVGVLAATAVYAGPRVARRRARARASAHVRGAWPAAIDDTISAIRAGVLPHDAVLGAMQRMPAPVGDRARAAAADVRATGRVDDSLRWLIGELADPVADKLLLAVLVTRHLGSADVIAVLDDLSAAVRQEIEIADQIAARRSWVHASASVATAAPWVVVLALSARPTARDAYASGDGTLVLATTAFLSAAAHLLMRRLGRIPEPERLALR